MTAPTISSTVLDHVRAYAAQVRTHLADLPPEQVEELTDGLEADLAEALADDAGPVTTGEIPLVGTVAGADAGGRTSLLDLTRRFGPSEAYAAELRASAGLGEPATVPRRARLPRVLGRGLPARGGRAVRRLVAATEASIRPVLGTPAGLALAGLAALLRPLWWVLRGWLWFVLSRGVLTAIGGVHYDEVPLARFAPESPGTWLLAIVAMLLSLEVGRRRLARGTWQRRLALGLSGLALVTLPWASTELRRAVDDAVSSRGVTQYVEVPVEVPADPEDGVYVDGMLVSNLFVYDADGNPLDRVQIFDDRGRPVRTTYDDGWQLWSLPGVTEPWRFVSAVDVDGRDRWNVYPLMGAPGAAWNEDTGAPTLLEGQDLRTPPPPFAKAPALLDADE